MSQLPPHANPDVSIRNNRYINTALANELDSAIREELRLCEAMYGANRRVYGAILEWEQIAPLHQLQYLRAIRAIHAEALKINAERQAGTGG